MPSTHNTDLRIAEVLNVLREALLPFVEQQMRMDYKERWLEYARSSLSDFRGTYRGDVTLDVQALIRIANDKRHRSLYSSLSPRDRNLLYELREVRNRHAHQESFEMRDVERALDTLELFLKAIRSPAASVAAVRSRLSPPAPASSPVPAPAPAGRTDLQRGVRLFRYLAAQANAGRALGIGYADFIAFLHGRSSFHEALGRNYLPSDSGVAIELAWKVTDASGGRIEVTRQGRTICSGMDSYIWASKPPYDRPEMAWNNPRGPLPYSRNEWKAVFPDGTRHPIGLAELGRLK